MRANGLIKFLKRSVVVLACVFACDRAIGWWLDSSFYKQTHGDDLVSIYTVEKAQEDVLILGGSRASHDYRATDIERQTGLSCFNGGRDNMDILYINAILHVVTERYTPKVLLLDVTHLDLADYGGGRTTNIQRTSTALLPLAQRYPQLYPTVQLAGRWEVVKAAISHIYPYNSLAGNIVQNTYTRLGHQSIKGYEPLYRRMDSTTYKTPIWGTQVTNDPLNAYCVQALRDVVQLAREKHIRLIAVTSPFYFPLEFYGTKSYQTLRQTILDNGFEFYDFSHSPNFRAHPQLFDDDVHLNDSGAAAFSSIIASLIKNKPAEAP